MTHLYNAGRCIDHLPVVLFTGIESWHPYVCHDCYENTVKHTNQEPAIVYRTLWMKGMGER